MAVRVEIKSEVGTSRELARVLIFENDHLVAKVIAEIELKQGADGGWYNCVILKAAKAEAKGVLHHDDPPCAARLEKGFCPRCKFLPDTQSTCLRFYCPVCDVLLEKSQCPKCKQDFEHHAL